MKRMLASLLCISLLLCVFPSWVLSMESYPEKHYAGMGDYTVTLQADPVTSTPPSAFGTTAANGKVWTDKSVTVYQDHFGVTLSTLAQEYISESGETATSSMAADVVMILDLSGSMQNKSLTLDNTSMTRTKAMIKAVNEALDIIMQANEDNRVLIYTYQSNSDGSAPVTNELLPLGHYTNTSWTANDVFHENNGKYFNYATRGSSGVIRSASNLKKDGVDFTQTSLATGSGTCTQHGILKGVQALASAIGQENKSVDRKPYILLFTDGAPGNATTTWYDPSSADCSFDHSNSGTAAISALSILSAAYMKNALDTAYRTYNGKNTGIEWFNIGLGVNSNALGTLFLQPWTITTETSDEAQDIRSNIATYTSGQYAAYASYAASYAYTVDSYLVDGGDDLQDAFTELASRIEEETKVITSPIITVEGSVSDLTFTDTIGAGMRVSNVCLHPDEDTAIFGILNGSTYSFNGYDTSAVLTTDGYGRQVLTWNIPADEVAIFAFANRTDPTDGTYVAADPIRLTYDVKVADPNAYDGETLYSNAAARAEFSIPDDNTYYYEDNGTIKSAPFAAQTKSQNITGLSDHSTTYTTEAIQNGTFITATLGNNGKLLPSALLEKSAENAKVLVDTAVTFILAVTNKGQGNLSNVVLSDTLPHGLTYQAGSVQNATVSAEGSTLTFTVASIPAGQTVTVTYKAILSANADTDDTFTNTAAITHINEISVYGPAETSSTITAYRTYRVLYEWSGDIPAGQLLPTDSDHYAPGAYYPVDTNYTSQTKVENKDQFGNITERWSFSGWTDPNNGVMGDADVTLRGVWSYETFSYPAHRVIYTWSGDIPYGKVLPTDSNSYIKNQPYTVDSTYTAATVIETRDLYGNINGRYTFSGWSDPNRGVMGDADVTVPGVWNFEPVNVPAHRVIYTWSGDVPPDAVVPTDSNTYVKNQAYTVDSTFTSATEVLTYDIYGNVNGKYTFSGWTDPNSGVMGDADITVPGVWRYESIDVSSHRVYYVWSGEVPPDAIVPTDSNTYVESQTYTVDSTFTSATEVLTYDIYGNVNGKYTFSGWTDPNSGVMGGADVTVSGVWEYTSTEVPAYQVIYTWSGDVPPDAVVPTDSNTYVENQEYAVDSTFSSATEVLTYDAYGNINGKYTFSGWTDPNDGVMGNADVTVPGVWEYTSIEVPAHRVIYTWSGDIPLNKVLPADSNTYAENQAYVVDATFTSATEVLTYDTYGNVNGKYTFSGWTDPNDGIMGNTDVTVSGVWEFTLMDVPTHRVIYTWSGDIPPEKVLPTDGNTYAENQAYAVNTTFTSATEVLTYDALGNINGKYTFSGWADPNNGVMGDTDVTIPGVWEFAPMDVPAYRVIYTWSGDIPLGKEPPSDSNVYVTNQTYEVDTAFTSATEVLTYDAHGNINGMYTFSGWTDPNNGVMGEADVTIPGVWKFTSIEVPSAPDNPNTGETLPMALVFALLTMSVTELVLLEVLRRRTR